MLDLIFLVLMIIVLMKSLKGDFNLLMCNIATVVGVIAAIVGIISALFSDDAGSDVLGVLNVFVLIIAFVLKPVAKHFAKLYRNKIDEETRSYYEAEEHAKENFFRKVASDDAYLHAAERGSNPPNANTQATGEFPHGYNGGVANNAVFPQNVSSVTSPMATVDADSQKMEGISLNPIVANNAVFPQNGNATVSPMAANNAAFPKNGSSSASPMAANNARSQQNVNSAASPMAAVDADSPKTEGISPDSEIVGTQPYDFSADNNYGLPYDLSAPIDLDRGINDDFSDKGK